MAVNFLNVLETYKLGKPSLSLLCEIFRTCILEEFLKLVIVTSQVLIADPMQIILAFELLDDNLLIKAHKDKLLDRITNEIIIDQLAVSILPYLLQYRFTQIDQPFFVNTLSENLERCLSKTLITGIL